MDMNESAPPSLHPSDAVTGVARREAQLMALSAMQIAEGTSVMVRVDVCGIGFAFDEDSHRHGARVHGMPLGDTFGLCAKDFHALAGFIAGVGDALNVRALTRLTNSKE